MSTAIYLLVCIVTAHSVASAAGLETKASPRLRRMQDEDGCANFTSSSDGTQDLLFLYGDSSVRYLRPSVYESCMASLRIDTTNTVDHITNLRKLYSQY
jgi:hypothetical protein